MWKTAKFSCRRPGPIRGMSVDLGGPSLVPPPLVPQKPQVAVEQGRQTADAAVPGGTEEEIIGVLGEIICIFLAYILLFLGIYLNSRLTEPEMIPAREYVENGQIFVQEARPNPGYVRGPCSST